MMTNIDLEQCIPHRYPMRLVDSVLDVNAELARCKTIITERNIFYDPIINGVYSWVGLELMAQTAAVFAHWQSLQVKLQIGFLISARKFSCRQLFFKLDDILITTAVNEYLQEGIGVFNCQIELNGDLVASARLTAIQSAE